MAQVLHGSARTTAAVRRAIQHSQESLQSLATRYSINPKTVAKWRKRPGVRDARMGPEPASTVLSAEQEAIAVAFRQHTLLALDDCLYALQATIPHLSRSALHRCFQRHGISRLPLNEDGQSPPKKKFKDYPIGYLPVDFAEVQTEEGKQYLFVAIDRTSKVALCRTASPRQAGGRGRFSAARARQVALQSAYGADGQRRAIHAPTAPIPAGWAPL